MCVCGGGGGDICFLLKTPSSSMGKDSEGVQLEMSQIHFDQLLEVQCGINDLIVNYSRISKNRSLLRTRGFISNYQ